MLAAAGSGLVAAGPTTARPDYTAIDSQPLNRVVYRLFRNKMVQAIGSDSSLDGWVGDGPWSGDVPPVAAIAAPAMT